MRLLCRNRGARAYNATMNSKPTSSSRNPSKVRRARIANVPTPGVRDATVVVAKALKKDLDAHRKMVSSSKDEAVAFLKRAGLLTPSGKRKTLVHG